MEKKIGFQHIQLQPEFKDDVKPTLSDYNDHSKPTQKEENS